jgi:hypothetical protein
MPAEGQNAFLRGWAALLGVLFGGTALFGFYNLHRSLLPLAGQKDWGGFIAQLFFAASFYVFLAHAAGASFRLADPAEGPRGKYQAGAGCLLDLAMAFLLYTMIASVTSPRPTDSTLIVFSAAALWHLAAMARRFLALGERGRPLFKSQAVRAHLAFLGAYVLLIYLWANFFVDPAEGFRKSFDFLWVICAVTLWGSLWRAGEWPD